MKIFSKESLAELSNNVLLNNVLECFLGDSEVEAAMYYECPYCGANELLVNKNNSNYYCWECGAHGDAVSFLMNVNKLAFDEAVEVLAEMYDVELDVLGPRSTPLKNVQTPDALRDFLFDFIDSPSIIHSVLVNYATNVQRKIDREKDKELMEEINVQQKKKTKKGARKSKKTNRKAKKDTKSS